MRAMLSGAINQLSDREKLVVVLYYFEGLTLAEIGEVLGVTESRVCQIHTKAVGQLRGEAGRHRRHLILATRLEESLPPSNRGLPGGRINGSPQQVRAMALPSRRGFGTAVLGIAFTIASLLVPLVQSSRAATACRGSDTNFFDGWGRDPTNQKSRGAQADIQVLVAPLCLYGGQTRVTAWSMLQGDDGDEFAQIGYQHKADSGMKFFYEWEMNFTDPDYTKVLFGSPVTEDFYNFKAARGNSGSNHIHLYWNGTDKAETNFDPLDANSGWGQTVSKWFGETIDPGDDMPGTPSQKTDFKNIQFKDASNSWVDVTNFNITTDHTTCYYLGDILDPNPHFQIWTSGPDHPC
jgi:hypothetical protein